MLAAISINLSLAEGCDRINDITVQLAACMSILARNDPDRAIAYAESAICVSRAGGGNVLHGRMS
jgi:hypothetical protein